MFLFEVAMALFRCVRSGNTIRVDVQDDIDALRKQENYVEVLNESKTSESRSFGSDTEKSDANEKPQGYADEEVSGNNQAQGQDVLKRRRRGRQPH